MLGFAWQKGFIPLGDAAIEQAIELNGVAVAFNKRAFLWGRRAAHDLPAVLKAAGLDGAAPAAPAVLGLEEVIARRVEFLTGYQDAAYATRYEALVRRVAEAERLKAPGRDDLARAVARSYFKLLAYKDEYEVARLYTDGSFQKQLADTFENYDRLVFHMAPPLVAERDPATGHLKKRTFGPWMRSAFKVLARLKGLRGTALDVFGRTDERRMERRLIGEYEATVAELLAGLNDASHPMAVEIARIPEKIRGYGHVKEKAVLEAKTREGELLAHFRRPLPATAAAE
jgi:indolepyruvate ferredoxin oxidoreductase